MPRIYYNQSDLDTNRNVLLLHGVGYLALLTWLWQLPNANFALILTPIWTLIFATHCFMQTPLTEGMQRRTYDRLRNKFGADWDIAATTEKFELERKRAQLDTALGMVLSGSITTGSLIIAMWVLLALVLRDAFPADYFISAFSGWGIYLLLAQGILRLQLRENRHDLRSLKHKKSAQTLAHQQSEKVHTLPRIGMTFTVGDDGELVEVPKQNKAQ